MAVIVVGPVGHSPTPDYNTLADAVNNANPSDIIEIEGDWSGGYDSTDVTVNIDDLTIRTKAGDQARHAGYETNGPNYKLNVSNGAHCITNNADNLVIDGLIIVQAGSGSSDEGIRHTATAEKFTVLNTIFHAPNNAADQDGIYVPNVGAAIHNINFENCVFIGWGRAGFRISSSSSSRVYNASFISCVAWNCGRRDDPDGGAVVSSGSSTVTINWAFHNCFFLENSTGDSEDFQDSGSSPNVSWGIDNCMCSDNSILARDPGAFNSLENVAISDGAPAANTVTVGDITNSPYDLRIVDGSLLAQDEHDNASGAGLTFGDFVGSPVDVVGTTRPQNTDYDTGHFEIEAAVGPGTVEADKDYRWSVTSRVNRVLDYRWAMFEEVSRDRDYRWGILKQVQEDKNYQYVLAEYVQVDKDYRNALAELVQADKDYQWSIQVAGQVTADKDYRWDVAAAAFEVQADKDYRWGVLKQVQEDKDYQYALLSRVQTDKQYQWNVTGRIQADKTYPWNVGDVALGCVQAQMIQ